MSSFLCMRLVGTLNMVMPTAETKGNVGNMLLPRETCSCPYPAPVTTCSIYQQNNKSPVVACTTQ